MTDSKSAPHGVRFSLIFSLITFVSLVFADACLAQPANPDAPVSSIGSVLNILFLGLIAYFLVRAFRRRSGDNDRTRQNRWADRMQDKEDESAHRPMDRHEAARQMWSVLSSEPSETPVRQSPKVESDSFDEAEFLEGAKLFFSRFQQVRDVSELDELRSLLSDSAYEDAVAEVQRRSADEQTEIMLLNARLMDMKTDNNRTDVSVFYDADLRKGVSGEQSVHVRAVWEFSRDGSGENVFWILEKINKVDQ